jgi:hypothetical protein
MSFILLTYQGPKYLALNIVVISALILTHPISPLFLWIYIFSALFLSVVFRTDRRSKITLFSLLAFLSTFWFIWTYFVAAPNYNGIDSPLNRVLSLEFLNKVENTLQWTAGGQGFIFPEIGELSLYIYAIFGILIVLITGWTVTNLLKKRRQTDQATRTRLQLAIAALGSAAIGYLLFSASGERFLLGRGLLFFLLLGSVCVASYLQGVKFKQSKMWAALTILFIIVLSLSFPVVSYSKENYNTFTPDSEGALIFLTTQMDLINKTISMGYDQQLAAYANLSNGFKLVGFPPNFTINKPDIVVLRLNYYYLLSMRYDFSFTNNSYTRAQAYLDNCTDYKMVFVNDQSQVWVKIP